MDVENLVFVIDWGNDITKNIVEIFYDGYHDYYMYYIQGNLNVHHKLQNFLRTNDVATEFYVKKCKW